MSGKLSRKIIGMLFVFFLVALSAIAMTLYLSWQLEGVAAAINDAGSQRMRTYRMAHLMSRGLTRQPDAAALAGSLQEELARFDRVLLDLRHGDPARPLAPPRDPEVEEKLLAAEASWRDMARPIVAEFLSTRQEPMLTRVMRITVRFPLWPMSATIADGPVTYALTPGGGVFRFTKS